MEKKEKSGKWESPYSLCDLNGKDRVVVAVDMSRSMVDGEERLVPHSAVCAYGDNYFGYFDCAWSRTEEDLFASESGAGPGQHLDGTAGPFVWLADGFFPEEGLPDDTEVLASLPDWTSRVLVDASPYAGEYCDVCDDYRGLDGRSRPCPHLYEDEVNGGMNGSGADPECRENAMEDLLLACSLAEGGRHVLLALMRAKEARAVRRGIEVSPYRILFRDRVAPYGMCGNEEFENFFESSAPDSFRGYGVVHTSRLWMSTIDAEETPAQWKMTRDVLVRSLARSRHEVARPRPGYRPVFG